MKCSLTSSVKLSITIDNFMIKVSACIRALVEVRPIISTDQYNSIPADGAQFISNLQSFSTTNFSFYYKKKERKLFWNIFRKFWFQIDVIYRPILKQLYKR